MRIACPASAVGYIPRAPADAKLTLGNRCGVQQRSSAKTVRPTVRALRKVPAEILVHRLQTKAVKVLYGLRKRTVEPMFDITTEEIGFRRFLLRGLERVSLEWTLVSPSYNLKRLSNLGLRIQSR